MDQSPELMNGEKYTKIPSITRCDPACATFKQGNVIHTVAKPCGKLGSRPIEGSSYLAEIE